MNPEIVSFQYATGMCLLLENVGGCVHAGRPEVVILNICYNWPVLFRATTILRQLEVALTSTARKEVWVITINKSRIVLSTAASFLCRAFSDVSLVLCMRSMRIGSVAMTEWKPGGRTGGVERSERWRTTYDEDVVRRQAVYSRPECI